MKKKLTKPTTPTPKHNSERETRILLEEMNQGIKTISEQHGSIVKKLEEHDKRFDKMESKLDTVEMELGSVKSELGSVKMAVRENSQRLDRVEKKLDTSLADHEERLKKLEVA